MRNTAKTPNRRFPHPRRALVPLLVSCTIATAIGRPIHAANPPQKLRLIIETDAGGDPGGQPLTFTWWLYPECGTSVGSVEIRDADRPLVQFTAPPVDAPATLHILLTARDDGFPPLARYGRVVLNVAP